jgi:predicted YcjX-like family ATPase
MGDGRKFSNNLFEKRMVEGNGKVKGRRPLTAADEVKATSMAENFQDYLLNSTLHGLRYIGMGRLSNFER